MRPQLRWGVGARLSSALLLVLAGAFAIVYLAVVPSLERRLIDNRLDQLQTSAMQLRRDVPQQWFLWETWVDRTARSQDARVLLYVYLTIVPPDLSLQADSGFRSTSFNDDPIAERSGRTLALERGTVERNGRRYAEVSVPVHEIGGPFLLLSSGLDDTLDAVDYVKQSILIAGLLAFGAALLVGFTGASMFAGRIRRLERAADRIASGHFDEPIVDPRSDELGELARAFDRMR
ncbi:MAG TPA: HAMP domain-containing protein, partial [Gaiellaceae bacterium]|nr:HAMP domain-containing protein [Gaiellaceae bacterium]